MKTLTQILNDPRYKKASLDEREAIVKDWYENGVRKDPRWTPEIDKQIKADIQRYAVPTFRPQKEIKEYKPTLADKARNWLLGFKLGKESIPPLEIAKRVMFEKQKDPKVEAMRQAVANFVNTGAFNLPYFIAGKLGIRPPEAETTPEKIAAGLGALGGFIKGAIPAARAITTRTPLARGLYTPSAKTPTAIAKLLGRGAAELGTAEALLTPTQGLLAPEERIKQFISGAKTGIVFSGLGLISSKTYPMLTKIIRMGLTSLYSGLPSTLAKAPLPEQVFNYGLGLYFGRHGVNLNELKTLHYELKKKAQRLGIKDYRNIVAKTEELINKLESGEKIDLDNPLGISKEFIPKEQEAKYKDFLTKVKKGEAIELGGKPQEAEKPEAFTKKQYEYKPLDIKKIEPSKREKAILINKIGRELAKKKTGDIQNLFGEIKDAFIKSKETGRVKERRYRKISLRGAPLKSLPYSELVRIYKDVKRYSPSIPKEMSLVPIEPIDLEKAPKKPTKLNPRARIYQSLIKLWGEYMGTGLKHLENIGFGERWTKGLVKDFLKGELDKLSMKNTVADLIEAWDNILRREVPIIVEGKYKVATGKKASEAGWKYLEGELEYQRDSKDGRFHIYKDTETNNYIAISQRQKKVFDQIKKVYDILLTKINNLRKMRGQEPITPRKNYVTHIFHSLLDEFALGGKLRVKDLPPEIQLAMDFIPAKGDYDPYLLKRYGVKVGLKKDILASFGAYAGRATDLLGSEPIRQANMIKKYLEHKAKQEPDSPVDYVYLTKALDRFTKEYANRPFLLDTMAKELQRNIAIGVGKALEKLGASPELQRRVAEFFAKRNIIDELGGATYLLGMGFRPHSASKNFFQHLLTLNFVKPKYLYRAIIGGNDLESRAALAASLVYNSRKAAFTPETELLERFGHRVNKSAFRMFRAVDRKNVKDAFLSAYYQARANGKDFIEAVREGDRVAANTQWLYLHSNRIGIARKFGKAGRLIGVFGSWPVNWTENVVPLMFSKSQKNIEGVMRYAIGSAILVALASALGIKYFPSYTGWTAIPDLIRRVSGAGGLPTAKLLSDLFKLKAPLIKDLKRLLSKEDAWRMLLEVFFNTGKE